MTLVPWVCGGGILVKPNLVGGPSVFPVFPTLVRGSHSLCVLPALVGVSPCYGSPTKALLRATTIIMPWVEDLEDQA